jgi:hypothetical protein
MYSVLESPPNIVIALPRFMIDIAHLLNLRSDGVPSFVLAGHHPPQKPRNSRVAYQIRKCERVTQHVARLGLSAVQLRTNDSTAVADADLHGVGDGSLGLARHIDGRPRERQSYGRIDTRGCEDSSCVRDTRARDWVGIRQQDDVAYDAQAG